MNDNKNIPRLKNPQTICMKWHGDITCRIGVDFNGKNRHEIHEMHKKYEVKSKINVRWLKNQQTNVIELYEEMHRTMLVSIHNKQQK